MTKWNEWITEYKRRKKEWHQTTFQYKLVIERAMKYFLVELKKRYEDYEDRAPTSMVFTAWHLGNLPWPGWEWRNAFDSLVELQKEWEWLDKKKLGLLDPILDPHEVNTFRNRMAYWQHEIGEITREEYDEARKHR